MVQKSQTKSVRNESEEPIRDAGSSNLSGSVVFNPVAGLGWDVRGVREKTRSKRSNSGGAASHGGG